MSQVHFSVPAAVTVDSWVETPPRPPINALTTGGMLSVSANYPVAVKGCDSDMLTTSVLFLLVSTSSLHKRERLPVPKGKCLFQSGL